MTIISTNRVVFQPTEYTYLKYKFEKLLIRMETGLTEAMIVRMHSVFFPRNFFYPKKCETWLP